MTDLTRTVPRRVAAATAAGAAALLLAAASAGCGGPGNAGHAPARTPAAGAASPAAKVTIAATDRAACAQLLSRLQQATQAISASSELIASSLDKKQLSQRIAAEAGQLRQSAELMSERPVPGPLVATDQQLVTALQALSADFARATGPAGRGDFRAAVEAMGDKPVVQKIVDASTTIQNACT